MQIVRASFALAAAIAAPAFATVSYQTDFQTYATGNLVGQNGWQQVPGSGILPIQVNAGKLVVVPALGTNSGDGEDAFHAFTPISASAGTSVFVGATINVNRTDALNSSNTGTSYVLALNTTDPFANLRVVTRQGTAPGTFQFGIRPTGQSGNNFAWGANLSLNTTYNLVLAWNFVSGAQNDTIRAWINPVGSNPASNPAYASNTQNNATGDAAGFGSIVISQFTSGSIPQTGATFGRLIVANNFGEVTGFVPTPATAALMALGGLAAARRRR